MIKKALYLVCLIGVSTITFGQENSKSKFGYGMSFGFGNSTLENNQLGILNGNLLSLRFNVDYSLTKKENKEDSFFCRIQRIKSLFLRILITKFNSKTL